MIRLLLAFAVATLISFLIGPYVMKWLHKLKFGQTIYDLGPQAHLKKQGTPPMGGIIFAVSALVASVLVCYKDAAFGYLFIVVLSALGFGLIGFTDDYIKVSKKRHEGLTPKQKVIPQFVISLVLAVWAYCRKDIGSSLTVPFVKAEWNLGLFYIPVMVFILVGTVNSANLLDGLDGLLGGCSFFDFVTMAIIAGFIAQTAQNAHNVLNVGVFAAAMAGGIIGFLRYNHHPARVFMGDVGSFFVGGALSGMALVTRTSLYLPLIALAMLVSSLSDIIQITYFKKTHGKRVFKMAPLHHHFELCGYKETSIVHGYYLATILFCGIAILGYIY